MSQLSVESQIEIESQTVSNILALQEAKRELNTLHSSLHRLSPDLGKVVAELERCLELRGLASRQGLDNIAIQTGRVLELCLSLLLVTLRVGTPSNSPFDVRLAWLDKLQQPPFLQQNSPQLTELLKWNLSHSSLVAMRLVAAPPPAQASSSSHSASSSSSPSASTPTSRRSSMPELEPLREDGVGTHSQTSVGADGRLRIGIVRQAVQEVVRILADFGDLQSLLHRQISDYCGQPPTGSKHFSKLCCFSIDGKCMRPEGQCPYAHSYEQIREFQSQLQSRPRSEESFRSSLLPIPSPSPPLPLSLLSSLNLDDPSPSTASSASSFFSSDSLITSGLEARNRRASGPARLPHLSLFSQQQHLPPSAPAPDAVEPEERLYNLYSDASPFGNFHLSPLSSPPPLADVGAPIIPFRHSYSGTSGSSGRPDTPGLHQEALSDPRHSWPSLHQFGPAPLPPGSDPSDDDDLFDDTNLPPHRRKTIICRHWRRSFCRLGTNCNFAHGSDDLVPSVRKFAGTTIPPPPPLRRYQPLI